MKYSQIVKQAAKETWLKEAEVKRVLKTFFNLTLQSDRVIIPNVGIFTTAQQDFKPYHIYLPGTRRKILVKPKKKTTFKLTKGLKNDKQ